MIDPTFPFTSLLAGFRLGRVLERLFEDLQIEDLPLPYYCVSTCLTSAKTIDHMTGSLRRAIRASCSLPGIFPPVHFDRELLVDGGVMNNLPIDVMANYNEGGTLVAVDVSSDTEGAFDPSYHDRISGWGPLSGRILPFVKSREVPNIFDILMRSTVVGSRNSQRAVIESQVADLVINPPVQDFGVLDFSAHEELYQIGLEHTTQVLSTWERPHTACEIIL